MYECTRHALFPCISLIHSFTGDRETCKRLGGKQLRKGTSRRVRRVHDLYTSTYILLVLSNHHYNVISRRRSSSAECKGNDRLYAPSLAMNRVGTNETALHDLSQLLQTGTIPHI